MSAIRGPIDRRRDMETGLRAIALAVFLAIAVSAVPALATEREPIV